MFYCSLYMFVYIYSLIEMNVSIIPYMYAFQNGMSSNPGHMIS
jgi:hypothetical protein